MKLIDVGWRTSIELTRQKLPSGPEYVYVPDGPAATRRARREVITWTDLPPRRSALLLLEILERQIERGQVQLLLRADDYFRDARPGARALFAVLAADKDT